MGLFDRFTSQKGKDQKTGPKRGVVKETKAKSDEQKKFAAVPAEKTSAAISAAKPVSVSSNTAHLAHALLVRPIVTEKSTKGGAIFQYTFEVKTTASKADIRRAIHHLYGVTPVAVNMLTMRGKEVRFGRTMGRTATSKKAIVTLPAGKTIDVVSA